MPTNGNGLFQSIRHRTVAFADGGTAKDFQEARSAFERSWRQIEPIITDADRAEQRRERAHTAWKYKMWEIGCKFPTQVAHGQSRCFCGAAIGVADVGPHIAVTHMQRVGC